MWLRRGKRRRRDDPLPTPLPSPVDTSPAKALPMRDLFSLAMGHRFPNRVYFIFTHHCYVVQVDSFCKLLSEFSMEYRTTHGKVLARLERKKHEKERKKTKGKFIVSDFPNFSGFEMPKQS